MAEQLYPFQRIVINTKSLYLHFPTQKQKQIQILLFNVAIWFGRPFAKIRFGNFVQHAIEIHVHKKGKNAWQENSPSKDSAWQIIRKHEMRMPNNFKL